MPGAPPHDSGSNGDPPAQSGGTVRAWNPLASSPGSAVGPTASQDQTVRARVPTPPPVDVPAPPSGSRSITAPAPAAKKEAIAEMVEELVAEELAEELSDEEVEAVDVEMLEPVPLGDDVPVSRYDAPTLKEVAAENAPELDILRDEPPAVAGEMSVVEPEPYGMFDPRPRGLRPSTEPAEQAEPTRADPPAVAGEMSVTSTTEPPPPSTGARVRTAPQTVVRQDSMSASGPQPALQPDPMSASGPQPVVDPMGSSGPQQALQGDYMSSSGPQPALQGDYTGASGPHPSLQSGPHPALAPGARPRQATDQGMYVGGVYSETTGPQPVAQAEITVPHQVMRMGARARPDRTLWYVALALVVLAVGGVILVVSRAS